MCVCVCVCEHTHTHAREFKDPVLPWGLGSSALGPPPTEGPADWGLADWAAVQLGGVISRNSC